MMYSNYEEIPLMLFMKIAKDEKRYMHLLRNGEKAKNKKVKKIWESHKDRWDADNPTSEWVQQKTLYKKCLLLSTKLKKDSFFIDFLTSCELVPSEEVFKAAGWTYTTDLTSICKKVEKSIKKHTTQLEISEAKYKNLIDSLKDQTAIEKEETNINEVIASLEIATGLRLEHSKITIGEYNGLTKALQRKNKLLEQQHAR